MKFSSVLAYHFGAKGTSSPGVVEQFLERLVEYHLGRVNHIG